MLAKSGKTTYSPRSIARALGVGESTIKRWCDLGLLSFERTIGGHRRLPLQEVLAFARAQGLNVVLPSALGLAADGRRSAAEDVVGVLFEHLARGDSDRATRLLTSTFLAGAPVERIFDGLIAPAMERIGNGWARGQVEIYQERRACEIVSRALVDLGALAPPHARGAPTAIGGTLSEDPFGLGTLMVENTLRHCGFQARSLGVSIPAESFVAALEMESPRVLWLSLGTVHESDRIEAIVAEIARAARRAKVTLILGGRGARASRAQAAGRRRPTSGTPLFIPDMTTLAEQARRWVSDPASL
jgi:MerR family transcriptional regulator, light-induced transcriptional regulator